MKDIKIFVFDIGNTLICSNKSNKISNIVLEKLLRLKEKGYIIGFSTLRTEEMINEILDQIEVNFLILANGGYVKVGDEIIVDLPIIENKIVDKNNNLKIERYIINDKTYAISLLNAKDKISIPNNYHIEVWDHSGNIDVTHINASKLKGIQSVCDYLNISIKKVVAFGDGFNDIETLKNVGYSVAMEGSPKKLIEVADYVTTLATDDGVAKALDKMEVL